GSAALRPSDPFRLAESASDQSSCAATSRSSKGNLGHTPKRGSVAGHHQERDSPRTAAAADQVRGAARRSGVLTLKNRTISPLAQRFIECAREVCKPLAEYD